MIPLKRLLFVFQGTKPTNLLRSSLWLLVNLSLSSTVTSCLKTTSWNISWRHVLRSTFNSILSTFTFSETGDILNLHRNFWAIQEIQPFFFLDWYGILDCKLLKIISWGCCPIKLQEIPTNNWFKMPNTCILWNSALTNVMILFDHHIFKWWNKNK